MHFDWVCIFVFVVVVVFVFFCSFPFLFVSLSRARSLVHSFSLNSFLPRCSLLSLLCLPASLDRWSLARSLTHPSLSPSLSVLVVLCALCCISLLALSLACSDFWLGLCCCCCAAWTSFAVGSVAFRFVSYHFVSQSETNEHTHTLSHACMHVHVHAVWQLTLLYLFAYYSFVNFLWLCRRLLWSPNNN